MALKDNFYSFLWQLQNKNSSYFFQLRSLREDPPQSFLRNAHEYSPPMPHHFELWIWNSLVILLCASPLLGMSIPFGRTAVLFVVGGSFSVLILWSIVSFLCMLHMENRAKFYFETFLRDCLVEAEAIHAHIGSKVKKINERTANYFVTLPQAEAQEILALVSLQGAIGDLMKRVEAFLHPRTHDRMDEALRNIRSPLRFGVTQNPPVTLLNSPAYLEKTLRHLEDRLSVIEQKRNLKKASND